MGADGHYQTKVHTHTVKRWRLMQGDAEVTERDFYQIAGDSEATQRIEKRHKSGRQMIWAGVAVAVAGAAATLGGVFYARQNAQAGYLVTGGGLMLVGGSTALISVGAVRARSSRRVYDMQRANRAALQYHARLLQPAQAEYRPELADMAPQESDPWSDESGPKDASVAE
jgi:hypothetical protein